MESEGSAVLCVLIYGLVPARAHWGYLPDHLRFSLAVVQRICFHGFANL